MIRLVSVLSVFLLASCAAEARGKRSRKSDPSSSSAERHDAAASIVLNGEKTEVVWTDGDSFKIKSGPHQGHGTRLQRFNTLEAYGPVHSWGQWTPPRDRNR